MKTNRKPELYHVVIVDDELIAIDHLETLLRHHSCYKVAGKTTSPEEAIPLIKKLSPDLVFLDIQMPGKNGLEILKEISLLENPPRVIMVTAWDQFVLDALRNNAFDYLLKPLDPEELVRLAERLDDSLPRMEEKKNIGRLLAALSHKIQVRGVYEDFFFMPSDIIYLEGQGKYTFFHLVGQKPVMSSQNLSMYEKELAISGFVRISKSHIINTGFLVKTDKKQKMVILSSGEKETFLPYSGVYF